MTEVNIVNIDEERSREANPRELIDETTVIDYAQILDTLPPIDLFEVDGALLVADGLHRLAAAKRNGLEAISANVVQGTEAEWIEATILGNVKHGRAWSRAEKRNCIDGWLTIHTERADAWIGRDLGVGKNLVGKRREGLEAESLIDFLDPLIAENGDRHPRKSPAKRLLLRRPPKSLSAFASATLGYLATTYFSAPMRWPTTPGQRSKRRRPSASPIHHTMLALTMATRLMMRDLKTTTSNGRGDGSTLPAAKPCARLSPAARTTFGYGTR